MPVKTKPQTRATLTDQQRRFCEAYLKEPNGTKAAIKAGYKKTTARFQAARLLTKANVKAELARLRAAREERTAITADAVLHDLAAEARRQDERASHSARVRALELLGKHLGLFREKLNVEVSGTDGRPVEVQVYLPATDQDTGHDDTELEGDGHDGAERAAAQAG